MIVRIFPNANQYVQQRIPGIYWDHSLPQRVALAKCTGALQNQIQEMKDSSEEFR